MGWSERERKLRILVTAGMEKMVGVSTDLAERVEQAAPEELVGLLMEYSQCRLWAKKLETLLTLLDGGDLDQVEQALKRW